MRVYVETLLCEVHPGLISCETFSTVDLLAFSALFAAGLDKASEFLWHQFPMVRILRGLGLVEITHSRIDKSCHCRVRVPRHAE